MKITRLVVRNFRGIEAQDIDVPPTGAVVRGRNGAGKTSVLNAIRAALAGRDIGPDAVRLGADKAEILVDLDDLTVRRVITPKSSTVTVSRGDAVFKKPQTLLTELLGTAALDPLEFYLAKPAERRALVLAAMPVAVTPEQLAVWAPGIQVDTSGHGLEVVDRAHRIAYDQRTAANAQAKAAKAAWDSAKARAESFPADLTDGAPAATCEQAVASARAEIARLQGDARRAVEHQARTTAQRERVATLRSQAGPEVEKVDVATQHEAEKRVEEAQTAVDDLRKRLADAERWLAVRKSDLSTITQENDERRAAASKRAGLLAQATALEEALDAAAPEAPAPEAIANAEQCLAAAEARLTTEAAKTARYREAAEALNALDGARLAAGEAQAEADRLDAIVRTLSKDAPAELLAASAGIPGLSISGDQIMLDGVSLDGMCGAEQMTFAVEIARRLNAKSKILVVDGLERLDPEQYEHFVRIATAGGYQLVATKVAAGEVVIEAIAPDCAEAAE